MTEKIKNIKRYGLTSTFDELYANSKNGDNFYKLMDIITSESNILLAYHQIKSNNGAHTEGVDGVTIEDVKVTNVSEFVAKIQKRLSWFKPDKTRRVLIPKQDGSTRPLGIGTLEDRVIQQCILQVLEPVCEAKFYKHSYGFRPNRNAMHALSRTVSLINRGKMYYCVDVDIKGFFDNVNHAKLSKSLWSFGIRDKRLLSIINCMLRTEVVGVGVMDKGLPQGGVLSPLLANIYLTELDRWVESQWESFPIKSKNIHSFHNGTAKRTNLKSGYMVRYADDFKIMCRSYNHAVRFYHAVVEFLDKRLRLEVNTNKSSITNLKQKHADFLGFSIKAIPKGSTKNGYVAQTNISEKSRKRIQEKLRDGVKKIQHSSYSSKSSMNYNTMVMGIKNYYRYATHVYIDLDKVGLSLSRTMKVRLRERRTIQTYKEQNTIYKQRNVGLKQQTKISVVGGVPLHVINAVHHRNPMNFQQDITPYTKGGRAKLETSKPKIVPNEYVQYMVNKARYTKDNVEFVDNRLTLYVATNGKCYVTGEILHPNEVHCHHKLPRNQGGTDEYHNLCLVHKDIHKLIHAINEETIATYLNDFNLDSKQIKKLNRLRFMANLDIIQ
ncbi:group II intron reverse transcriptase/maturase [Bacillus cereus]|uniref:group II intron reverse transcriptase/maturase n=1 Tax=Bacillus cereus TaxID=1396 RepID=UPI001879557A|nr:group II intron reverse transcriptase/maturase [Bacillus cereus]MBE7106146.1 group II intron reverse transcriptase/maturase [Bacillus cereus]